MPVKRRLSKRRLASAPAEAWFNTFAAGHDFLGDLAEFGFPDDAAARDGAREAWREHGAAFLAAWQPYPAQPTPWALDAFGKPEGMTHAN